MAMTFGCQPLKMYMDEPMNLAELHQLQHERSLLEQLDALRDIDPDVVRQTVEVFDDKTNAANWLASPVGSMGGVIPLQALVDGKREDVLRALQQIRHGVYG